MSEKESEDRQFEKDYVTALTGSTGVDYKHAAHVLSGRLRQMDKRAAKANQRADEAASILRSQAERIKELEATLRRLDPAASQPATPAT